MDDKTVSLKEVLAEIDAMPPVKAEGHEFVEKTCLKTRLELLPSAQPVDKDINVPTNDSISRQAAISICDNAIEVIRCKDCIYYDPPHVENNGVRYEYDEMPADAFDALGTGLVSAEYGINIGGRCCVDYYCKNYSDDKRVFVREDNYCGRAERRTDGSD